MSNIDRKIRSLIKEDVIDDNYTIIWVKCNSVSVDGEVFLSTTGYFPTLEFYHNKRIYLVRLCRRNFFIEFFTDDDENTLLDTIEIAYDITEDTFFQLSTVKDFGYIEYEHVELFKQLNNAYSLEFAS